MIGIFLSAVGFSAQAQVPPSTAVQAAKSAKAAASAQASSPSSKPAATKPARKAAAKHASTQAAPKVAAGSEEVASPEAKVARRDPFESLVGREKSAAELAKNLPPGKAGLQVASLRLDGIVRSPNGMIAVVTNPQSRTYFLREGDQLYDGRVEKIAMDGVSFHEVGKDAFGKPVERQVNKRIYSSAGEQQ
jgi:Tfp pilus assembly protein PilP